MSEVFHNVLSVEGNIGAGKSAFLQFITPHLKGMMERGSVHTLPEPVDLWKNVDGHGLNILDRFYREPMKYAFAFQVNAFASRLSLYANLQREIGFFDMALIERSVYGDHTMAENCRDSKMLDPEFMAIYEHTFQNLLGVFKHKPQGFIYVRTIPDLCVKRIIKRDRAEEAGMTASLGSNDKLTEDTKMNYQYIYDIHTAHERNFGAESGKSFRDERPVLIIDGSRDFVGDIAVQKDIAAKVMAFLEKTRAW